MYLTVEDFYKNGFSVSNERYYAIQTLFDISKNNFKCKVTLVLDEDGDRIVNFFLPSLVADFEFCYKEKDFDSFDELIDKFKNDLFGKSVYLKKQSETLKELFDKLS